MCLAASYQARVGEIYYACSKKEAMEVLPKPDKTKHFYSDQEKPGAMRDVPFIRIETRHKLEPFITAANQQTRK